MAFEKLNAAVKFWSSYIDAIDGIAVEDLFYDGKPKIDNYRLQVLRELQKEKQVMVSDFITKDEAIETV